MALITCSNHGPSSVHKSKFMMRSVAQMKLGSGHPRVYLLRSVALGLHWRLGASWSVPRGYLIDGSLAVSSDGTCM